MRDIPHNHNLRSRRALGWPLFAISWLILLPAAAAAEIESVALPSEPVAPATVDLLLIGDSITEGQGAPPGFRDDLHTLLGNDPNNTYNFVGSTGTPPLKGHFLGGQQINAFYPPGAGNGWGTGTFDVTSDMGPPNVPDMVAIHLGTNDVNSAPAPYAPYSADHGQTLIHSQSGELADFVGYLNRWYSGPTSTQLDYIVLSTIIPMNNRTADVRDFNREVVAMSEDLSEGIATGTPVKVTIADHNRRFMTNPNLFTFGGGDWMVDNLHPNNAGYVQMADVYNTAIRNAVNDIVPPEQVTNLTVIAVEVDRIRFTFNAPGDDAASGRAYRYDLRYSTGTITAANFAMATQAVDEPEPPVAGQLDTLEATGLFPGTAYSFALKVVDDAGNRSTISNVRSATTIGGGTQTIVLRQGLNGYNGSEDNITLNVRPTENAGGTADFQVGRHTSGDIARSLIRFDVSQIPPGAPISSAKLKLFAFDRSATTAVNVSAYRVTKEWVEGTRTSFGTQAGSSCWNAARHTELNWSGAGISAASNSAQNDDPNFDRYSTPEATTSLSTDDVWYEWDVKNAVEKWRDGVWNNDGLALIAQSESVTNRRFFRSSESTADQTQRPTLEVTYVSNPVNSPPIANAGGPYAGSAGIPVAFNGSGSFDPEGQPLTYLWNFGDGSTGVGATPNHTYAAGGNYSVSLTVNDGQATSMPDLASAQISGGATTYTITASAGANGAIAPSGAVVVASGGNQTFTITPNTGYHVANVLVDGVTVGAVTSYTFNNVTANHTIAASFAINTYTINASAGSNGAIAPSGAVSVNHGANQAFTITPNTGYHVADVLVDGATVGAVTSYTFNNVTANHTIAASFAINTYTITASAGANGAIAPSGAVIVNHGANQAFTITPNTGYHVANVLVDGVTVGAVTSYTFNNVTANHTIAASFAINTYTITASAGSNGVIAPSGAVSVNHGANQAFTITPNANYHVADVLVDNVSVGAVTSYTFNNVTANHTIAASFAINTYTITASAGANGAIAPSGAVIVNHGANQAFTITPNTGYHVANVLVDGVTVGAVTSYTFNNVTANHTIAASFAINTYTINASAGSNGAIAPTGAVSVNHGANQAFTITPNTGYHVADVLVDGVTVGAVTSYTFNNVTANHTIAASFAINIYTINASAGSNGAIAPSGAVSVNHGANQTFTITPNTGYHVANVLVDGVTVGAVTSYTFNNVTANHTIVASFAINTYTINASAGANGAIAPSGAVSVNHGANQAFTITPNTGYHVADVLVDGVTVGAVTSYTFNNVTANHTIAASFAINTYTISASAGANGAIAPSGAVSVNHGANQAFTITPNTGYHVADVLVDGVTVGAVTSYTFNNVTANHTIAASFAIDTFTITASAGAGGGIAPSGAVSVNYGASQAFTITPNTGFHVADVLVDGVTVGAVTSYTFNNVTANHTIAASFTIDVLTITATAGAGGAIAPSGAVSVTYGANQSFTITPSAHYHVADVLVDGVSAGAITGYTFTNVTANHTIAASFAIDMFTITASAGVGGAITPEGETQVAFGDSLAFTITPDPEFEIADVLVDKVSVGAVTTYTFTDVTANHTIVASFRPDVSDAPGPSAPILQTALLRNAPNPFSSFTTIRFDIAGPTSAELTIYSVDGRRVRVLGNQRWETGHYEVTWNGKDEGGESVAAGTYFVRMKTPDGVKVQKVTYTR